jgi:DNA-binding response OmpR family regulator
VRVLVVDGDPVNAESLTSGLRRHGHVAKSVHTGTEALRVCRRVDLVLLGFGLSDLDGLEVCRCIRSAGDTGIIAVTAPCTELERVLGLQAGLDDYVVRPYGISELLARMEAVIRRVRPTRASAETLCCGPLQIDPGTREVRIGDRLVDLTLKEFQLLHLLASEREIVVSRKRIMSEIWHEKRVNSSRTLDTHVNTLRNKLGDSTLITTVRGVGFQLSHP